MATTASSPTPIYLEPTNLTTTRFAGSTAVLAASLGTGMLWHDDDDAHKNALRLFLVGARSLYAPAKGTGDARHLASTLRNAGTANRSV